MLISCSHCGKIHEDTFVCKDKEEKVNTYKRKVSKGDRFRWTAVWQRKRREINERDNFMCQVCVRELYDTKMKYTYKGISVHHIIKLIDDWSLRLEDTNLICLCEVHHKQADDGVIGVEELRVIVREQEGKGIAKDYTPLA